MNQLEVTAFRAGAKYHNTPIMMYIMPHSPGNTPAGFRRSFYTAVAHGATLIHYLCATPLSVGGTENYIDTDDLPMWNEIAAGRSRTVASNAAGSKGRAV